MPQKSFYLSVSFIENINLVLTGGYCAEEVALIIISLGTGTKLSIVEGRKRGLALVLPTSFIKWAQTMTTARELNWLALQLK